MASTFGFGLLLQDGTFLEMNYGSIDNRSLTSLKGIDCIIEKIEKLYRSYGSYEKPVNIGLLSESELKEMCKEQQKVIGELYNDLFREYSFILDMYHHHVIELGIASINRDERLSEADRVKLMDLYMDYKIRLMDTNQNLCDKCEN